jgi:hypothetical protein
MVPKNTQNLYEVAKGEARVRLGIGLGWSLKNTQNLSEGIYNV